MPETITDALAATKTDEGVKGAATKTAATEVGKEGGSDKSTTEKVTVDKKTYEESTKESVRLAKLAKEQDEKIKTMEGQLSKFTEFEPFITQLQSDQALLDHIGAYYKGGKQKTAGVDEDVLDDFDMKEAIADPSSKSGQVLAGVVDRMVGDRFDSFKKTTRAEQFEENQRREFLRNHPDLKAADLSDLEGWARKNPSDNIYEDLYFLKNRDAEMKKVEESVRDEITKQMEKTQGTPTSLAAAASSEAAEAVIDRIHAGLSDAVKDKDIGSISEAVEGK